MKSIQIRLTDEQIKALNELVKSGYFTSRNEATREAVRRLLLDFSRKSKLRLGIVGPFKLTTEELLERLKSGDTRLESQLVAKAKRLLEPEP
ncbi:MAG: ribbon-helix-helix domain-containing protein [Candidatus Heimdallarchaeota archaeon]